MKKNMTYWNSIEFLVKIKDILVIISIISGLLTVLIMISSFIVNKRIDGIKKIKEIQNEQEIVRLNEKAKTALDSVEITKNKVNEANLKLKKIEDNRIPRHLTKYQKETIKNSFSLLPKSEYTIITYSLDDLEMRDYAQEFMSLFGGLNWSGGFNSGSAHQPYRYGVYLFVKNKNDFTPLEKSAISILKKAKIKYNIEENSSYSRGINIFVGLKPEIK